jgi:DNA-binding phage protein
LLLLSHALNPKGAACVKKKRRLSALKTADTRAIYLALDELVGGSSNVSILAKDAENDRPVLYRPFRGKNGPSFPLWLRFCGAKVFSALWNLSGSQRRSGQTGSGSETNSQLELRDNARASAEFLTRAFERFNIAEIGKALVTVLRKRTL